METSVVQTRTRASSASEPVHASHGDDLQWELTLRVVAGPHFARSPLLSKFLLFVVAETLDGRGAEITEHRIGVQVFDRPADYRTVEDNIVRNYARQLRKRLAEHFAGSGGAEKLRIDIPVGGYVPVFVTVGDQSRSEVQDTGKDRAQDMDQDACASAEQKGLAATLEAPHGMLEAPVSARQAGRRTGRGKRLRNSFLLALWSVVLVAVTWYAISHRVAPRSSKEPERVLWSALFSGPANSYIVPSDAGFNMLEDLSNKPVPLAQYIAGDYTRLPLTGVNNRSAENLRTQRTVPFVDLQIAIALTHLAGDAWRHVSICFPRDLRLDDLKNTNAIIIGSLGSNPWASIAESSANFHIAYRPDMAGAEIENRWPQAGESATYISHWNEPSHDTFALIEFLPNLSGNGHLLVIEGLDVAGTQAAAEVLMHPSSIDPVLRQATRPDGSLRNFEVLLRATSIESNATGTQLIASRIY